MERRDFIKLGAASVAVASTGLPLSTAQAATHTIELGIVDTQVELIDGTMVNMLAFTPSRVGKPTIPGPVFRVREGDTVNVTIYNDRLEDHRFEIPGIDGARSETIPGKSSRSLTFTAPVAGTYLYQDALLGPLYRILGLHGVLVVEPLNGRTAAGSQTPFSLDKVGNSQAVASVSAIFDALGTSPRFPGSKWQPCPSSEPFSIQERIWVLNQVDPRFNALIVPGRAFANDDALTSDCSETWTPRYFTINNRSGFDLAEGDDVIIKNYVGEPTLIRVVNAGLAYHSNHIHGNHVMELSEVSLRPGSGYGKPMLRANVYERDVWSMQPGQCKDVLLPVEIPPDIPVAQRSALLSNASQEKLPLRYVMHCHCEMSNTAGGGNYPQGMVTHWDLVGGVGGRKVASL